MRFEQLGLSGACVVHLEERTDDRGFFARAWCKKEFEEAGLNAEVVQANISYNRKKGTLRGLHYQVEPHGETKLVRCTKGAIYDVIVDLREASNTYRQWFGIELSDRNRRMLFVPEGFAHGFQTLADDSEVFYQVTEYYTPGAERGARFDDPAFTIQWPLPVTVISEKDASWPLFE